MVRHVCYVLGVVLLVLKHSSAKSGPPGSPGASPVDGKWGQWAPTGPCSVTCGSGGLRPRSRTCDTPPPSNGGLKCKKIDGTRGDTDSLMGSCSAGPCPVDGQWSQWGAFKPCSVSCGGGYQVKERTCTDPAPQNNGKACLGTNMETRSCNTQACPLIDGNWGLWTASQCSVTCGSGVRQRSRTCNNPYPSGGGQMCLKLDSTTRGDMEFETQNSCDGGPCPVHGGWGSWSPASQCNAECGRGLMFKMRVCDSPPPAHGGLECVMTDVSSGRGLKERREQECNTHACKPEWNSWESWDSCSRECGVGSRTRRRHCSLEDKCIGKRYETKECELRKCRETCEDYKDLDFCTGNSHCEETEDGPKCICPEGRSGARCLDLSSNMISRMVKGMIAEYDATVSQTDLWILILISVTFVIAFIAMIMAVMKSKRRAAPMPPVMQNVIPPIHSQPNLIYQPLITQAATPQQTYYLKQ